MKPFNPKEFKVMALRECPVPMEMLVCETPEQAVAGSIGANTAGLGIGLKTSHLRFRRINANVRPVTSFAGLA